MIVVDASFTAAFFFEDEQNDRVDAVMRRCVENGGMAPLLWTVEIANVFRMAVRRKRITAKLRAIYFDRLREIGVEIDKSAPDLAWQDLTVLADRHDLTVYDAAYLELAIRRRLPLATLDQDLAAAARREGLDVLP